LTFGALLGLPSSTGFLGAKVSATLLISFVLGRMILNPALSYALQWVGERVSNNIRLRLLQMATALPAINAGAIPSGELSTIINDEVSRCGRALVAIVTSVQVSAGVLFSIVFLIARDPPVNLAAIIATAPAMALYMYTAARSSKDTRRVVEARVQAGSKVTEGLRALAGIQAAGGGGALMQTLGGAAEEMRVRETKIYFNQGLLQYAMSLVPIVAAAGAFGYVWYFMGIKTAHALASVLLPTAVVGARVAAASSGIVMNVYATSVYATSFVPVTGLFERLTKLSRRNARDAVDAKGRGLARLELRNCSFQLPNNVWLFRDLSLSVAPDHPIIVRGASGTGKSTLASVIAGSNECTEGRIVYVLSDGTEIAPHDGFTNYLSQDPAVVAGPVRQNLLLGSAAPMDDAILIDALKRVKLWDEFAPNKGLEAAVFEGGRNLSGGQIRRLGLARLLTRDKGLWIFDEATASLDPESKDIVEEFIRETAKGRIVLIITHDPEFRLGGTEIQLFHNSSARLFSAA
jgi:ABC-type transport system involved in cytochrome bd biosynthesis fused ATPase/permease subunit